MKKRISILMEGDTMKADYDGFPGDSCKAEEEKLRAFMAGMGVCTDDIDTKLKRVQEANPAIQGQKVSG